MIWHLLSPLYVGGITKNQLRQIKNCWATHTQCTVISFCFFCFSRGNHDHPLSSSSTNEREKNSTDTQLYIAGTFTDANDWPTSRKRNKIQKKSGFPFGSPFVQIYSTGFFLLLKRGPCERERRRWSIHVWRLEGLILMSLWGMFPSRRRRRRSSKRI